MDTLIADESASQAAHEIASDLFLFYSDSSSVRAMGKKALLTTPINHPKFQQDLQALFQQEKLSGVERPIIVGAIPFDLDQPCYLIVPQWNSTQSAPAFDVAEFNDKSFVNRAQSSRYMPEYEQFVAGVDDALARFETRQLDKVVLSRVLDIDFENNLDVDRLMGNVMAQNPNAFHFRVPLQEGVLLGASPELLLRKQAEKIFSNPLAGSAKRCQDSYQDQATAEALKASDKDQFEHRLVVDSIREALHGFIKQDHIPRTPSLIHTPTMWHLSTRIEEELIDPSTCAFELIKALHPTPAMCGSPKASALSAIQAIEPYQRQFFSGLVGWCDDEGNGEWAIAIRCAHVSGNKARLFAGAGIVPGSDPDKEWRETGDKMRTMLNAFGIQ
ncbi:isochorismate synthase [Marinomonas ostreistagni]|uniref:isochorismate synthase n=1 Tax=Marinomonas ostreistagni TaxID=359209 RepID=UPI00194E4B87|nr:isochorismate synthase [Marinomonas ostreistagni]MBM6549489.1 isochorismate synthase [Marinomonas ostreistagni]